MLGFVNGQTITGHHCIPRGKLLQERKHAVIAGINMSMQMQQTSKKWEGVCCDSQLNIHDFKWCLRHNKA